jgi:hypothetical protein
VGIDVNGARVTIYFTKPSNMPKAGSSQVTALLAQLASATRRLETNS